MPKSLVVFAVWSGLAINGVASDAAMARDRGPARTHVDSIIIHATGGPSCHRGRVRFSRAGSLESMKRFFARSRSVSIHYIVGRDGRIAGSVPERQVAAHAGRHNPSSIGIELINAGDGVDPYPAPQMAALARLVSDIRRRWPVALADVKGHEEVDTRTFRCGGKRVRRKQDPGPRFPWLRFRLDLLVAEVVTTATANPSH